MNEVFLKCFNCQKTFEVTCFHAGFSDIDLLYCNKCPNAVEIDVQCDYLYGYFYVKYMNISFIICVIICGVLSFMLSKQVAFGYLLSHLKEVEKALKPCPCGGKFLFKAKPRCPHCLEPFSFRDVKKQWKEYHCACAIIIKDVFSGKDIWGDISYLKDELSYWAKKYDKKKFEGEREKIDKVHKFTWREDLKSLYYFLFQFWKLERARHAYEVLQEFSSSKISQNKEGIKNE